MCCGPMHCIPFYAKYLCCAYDHGLFDENAPTTSARVNENRYA